MAKCNECGYTIDYETQAALEFLFGTSKLKGMALGEAMLNIEVPHWLHDRDEIDYVFDAALRDVLGFDQCAMVDAMEHYREYH